MLLRCRLDGLLLPAYFNRAGNLRLADGDEEFDLEAIEATYYEVVLAHPEDWRRARARYRLLSRGSELAGVVGVG